MQKIIFLIVEKIKNTESAQLWLIHTWAFEVYGAESCFDPLVVLLYLYLIYSLQETNVTEQLLRAFLTHYSQKVTIHLSIEQTDMQLTHLAAAPPDIPGIALTMKKN